MFHLVDRILWWFFAFLCWPSCSPRVDWPFGIFFKWDRNFIQPALPPNACCQQQGEVSCRLRLGPSLQSGQGLTALFSLCNLSWFLTLIKYIQPTFHIFFLKPVVSCMPDLILLLITLSNTVFFYCFCIRRCLQYLADLKKTGLGSLGNPRPWSDLQIKLPTIWRKNQELLLRGGLRWGAPLLCF